MDVSKVTTYIIDWLKSYSNTSKTKGFVVGVSGGVDSAVTSTLCAKTGLPVLCIEMPIYQQKTQVDRAWSHMNALKARYSNVSVLSFDLTSVFDSFTANIQNVDHKAQQALALANTRSRLRMTTLYYHAGVMGYLVVGTGNKIEDFGVGFFTKYGDGGVDISPLADLLKSEVYQLAKHLEVNQSILEAPPTDGLWGDDRNDEDQLGATYAELEWAMQISQEDTNSFEGRQKMVMDIYKTLNKSNKHKVDPIPVCKIPDALR